MHTAFFFCCALLLIGLVLRIKIRFLKLLYVPASVVGGVFGCTLVFLLPLFRSFLPIQPSANSLATFLAGCDVFESWTQQAVVQLRTWPGPLIAVVFAGLLLERPGKPLKECFRAVARQAIFVWLIILGQVAIGILATWLVIRNVHEVPASFGQLIEVGFAGGHATATAMGQMYEKYLGFPAGRDLGVLVATSGLIYGVVSGMAYVNLAVRRGWTCHGKAETCRLSDLVTQKTPLPLGYARVRAEVIDPLVFQAILLASAYVLGIGLKQVMMVMLSAVSHGADLSSHEQMELVKFAEHVPLFLFTLLGGLLIRQGMTLLGIEDLLDTASLHRLTGAAMEVLIVAAITSMNLSALVTFGWSVALLLLLGALWTSFCLLVLARRFLPQAYWFELGILNYGMSTATTAQGLMLLRIVDPDLASGAAEDYALATPLSAPFVGGGLLTWTLPILLQMVPVTFIVVVLLVLMGLLAYVARLMAQP